MPSDYTVRRCIDEYIAWMESKRKSAADARSRADALILPPSATSRAPTSPRSKSKNGCTTSPRARRASVRKRAPTASSSASGSRMLRGDDEAKRKRRATANRTLTILKAALNRAWRDAKIASDDAWRRVEPFEEADAARVRYLTIAEAQRLINACSRRLPPSGPRRARHRRAVWRARSA